MTSDDQQRALDAITDRLRDEIARHVQTVVAELSTAAAKQAAEQAAEQAAALAERAAEQAAAEAAAARDEWQSSEAEGNRRLAEAIRSIDRASSLSETLEALAGCVGREASRAAILLVAGTRYRGWKFIGFDPSFDTADGVEFGVEEAGVIARAVKANALVLGAADGDGGAPAFAHLPAGRGSLAMPIAMGGEIVAVLYADAGHEPAVPSPEPQAPSPEKIEVLTRHAARCLEALTALKAAGVLAARPDPVVVQRPQSRASDNGRGDDEAAQRYARLLVSEIKLYHEGEVLAGRRDHDLAIRLGGEIARARALYEQRVPGTVRQRMDHFHAELVRTLADGDESLLPLGT